MRFNSRIKYLLIALLIAGCCPSIKETIRVVDIKYPVPEIKDTLDAYWYNHWDKLPVNEPKFAPGYLYVDTTSYGYWYGNRTDGKDTIISVKFYPNKKKFEIAVNPDSIIIRDTTVIYKEADVIVQETTFIEKLGWMLAGFIFVCLIWFIVKKFF